MTEDETKAGKNERGLSAPCPNYTFYFGRATPSCLAHVILEIHSSARDVYSSRKSGRGGGGKRHKRREVIALVAVAVVLSSLRSDRLAKESRLTVITLAKKVTTDTARLRNIRAIYTDVRDLKLSVSVNFEQLGATFFAGSLLSLSLCLDV